LLPSGSARSDAPLWGDGASKSVPIAQGVPVGRGFSASAAPMDAVPLVDQLTASLLQGTNNFTIAQRPSLTETLCPACERSNLYDVYDGSTGIHLFVAKERSGTCARFCCAPNHSLFVEFKSVAAVNPMFTHVADVDALPTVLTMEREGCPTKLGLGCCAFSSHCKDGVFVHAGSVGEDAAVGSLKSDHPQCIGFATQPNLAGGWSPTINIMERSGAGGAAFAPLAKLEGPTCFGGCMELCYSSAFTLSSMRSPAQLNTALKLGDFGQLVKRKPNDLDAALREAVTDADVYSLDLQPAAGVTAQQKATLLATLILTDYMFFERDGAVCDGNGCTLCLCHCHGCLCPIAIRGATQSANAGPSGTGGGGFVADQ